MSWEGRTGFQRFLLILQYWAVLVSLAAWTINLGTAIQAGLDGWFGKNSGRAQFFFYVLRIYAMFFACCTAAAEFPQFVRFHETIQIFRYYAGRGFFQVFVGFLTCCSLEFGSGSFTVVMSDIVGYVMLACGLCHFVVAAMCFDEYKEGAAGVNSSYQPIGGGAGAPTGNTVPGPSRI